MLTDFRSLQRAGAVAVTDDGKPILGDDIMRETLRLSGELSLTVIQHAEDTRMTANASLNESPTSFRLGLRGMNTDAEASIVERDVQLAQQFSGARLHVAHLSTADALKAVRRGRRSKARVTCEVTPHHFGLTDADIPDYNTNFKMNPPLRSGEDREAILVALADGTIDAIATDHAPHAPHEKIIEFERAAFGVTGLETAVGLAISELHGKAKIPLGAGDRAIHLRAGARGRSPRPRHSNPRMLRRRHYPRSQKTLDLRSRQMKIKVAQLSVRWLADERENCRDNCQRKSRLSGGLRSTRFFGAERSAKGFC